MLVADIFLCKSCSVVERDLFVCFSRVVYPPLAEMTDEDKANSWKPGQRKKKSERVDSTWNPKSKLVKK